MFFSMDFSRARKNDRIFRSITGMTVSEFDILLLVFEKILLEESYTRKPNRLRALGWGRTGHIGIPAEKLFFILFFLKVYPTCDVAGYIFASSKSSASLWSKTLLPILSQTLGRTLSLPTRQISTPEEFFSLFPGVKEIMIDWVERPSVRRKKPKNQVKNYSGKKKWPRRKNTIISDKDKKILYLSPTKNGKLHDKKQIDKTNIIHSIPEKIEVFVDSWFQWIQHIHKNTYIPKKRTKKHPLSQEQKEENHLISSIRVVIENAICWMKRFKTAGDTFRGRKWQDDTYTLIAAWLWNFHLQMKECWLS